MRKRPDDLKCRVKHFSTGVAAQAMLDSMWAAGKDPDRKLGVVYCRVCEAYHVATVKHG